MKFFLNFLLCVIIFANNSYGQKNIHYSGQIETGYNLFGNTLIDVDPGPNWRGYYLDQDQNGIEINFINGVKAYDRFYAGIGTGYLNYEGFSGISIFGNFEYIPLRKKMSPIFILKIGYDHLWNQYDGGKGTAKGEFGLGVNFKINSKLGIYFNSGMLLTLQSRLIPFRLGFRF